jgi:hypothetical protein
MATVLRSCFAVLYTANATASRTNSPLDLYGLGAFVLLDFWLSFVYCVYRIAGQKLGEVIHCDVQ